MTQTYRVQLESFEGPMDLLLYLIRRAEVDIEDIPIASIAGQYLDYLEQIDSIDIELAGEFLVTAATLMEIKSRMIRPPEDGEGPARASDDDADQADPRAELVKQLLAYKKHRDAADRLESRRDEWSKRSPAAPAGIESEAVREAMEDLGELELEDVDVLQLLEAYRSIVASVNFDRLGDHEVLSDDTPIELHAEDIVDRLQEGGRVTLAAVFEGRTRSEMVGLFLALLTLVRDQRVQVNSGEGGVGLVLNEEADIEMSDRTVPVLEPQDDHGSGE